MYSTRSPLLIVLQTNKCQTESGTKVCTTTFLRCVSSTKEWQIPPCPYQINCMISLDVLGGSEDGPAQCRVLVRGCMQVIKDHLLQIGLHFLHLSEDHPSLPFNLRLTQHAVLDDVGQDLHSLGGKKRTILYKRPLMFSLYSTTILLQTFLIIFNCNYFFVWIRN